jgi:hypothetical protein
VKHALHRHVFEETFRVQRSEGVVHPVGALRFDMALDECLHGGAGLMLHDLPFRVGIPHSMLMDWINEKIHLLSIA